MRKYVLILAVTAALIAAAFAATGSAPKSTITVGDFAVKVSRALGKPAPDQRAAVESLKSLGVKLGDTNASLTEGMAVQVLADLGVRVSTANPSSTLTPGKADQLAVVVALDSSAASTLPADGLPTQCLVGSKQQCKTCCWAATGCNVDMCPECTKFCKVLPPGHPSPDDPLP